MISNFKVGKLNKSFKDFDYNTVWTPDQLKCVIDVESKERKVTVAYHV